MCTKSTVLVRIYLRKDLKAYRTIYTTGTAVVRTGYTDCAASSTAATATPTPTDAAAACVQLTFPE